MSGMDLWVCGTCGDGFGAPVWECPKCGYHNHAGDPRRKCHGCHEAARRGTTSKVAAEDWETNAMVPWRAATGGAA